MSNDISTPSRLLLGLLGRVAPGCAARQMAKRISDPGGRNPPQSWESGPGPAGREVELLPGLYAWCWGESGPAVLAVHGWRGRPRQFLPLAGALLGHGYRTVALDLPGHGRSAGRYTPQTLGRLIAEVANLLGPVQGVVGHSYGGAVLGPALLQGLVTPRIVLVASPAHMSRVPLARARDLAPPPRVLAAFARILDEQAGRPAQELDLIAVAPAGALPGLIVHDQDDEVVPFAESQELAALWPQARLIATRGLGHRDVLADPAVIAAVAGFIAGPGP